jgi:hypothetical protein
VITPLSKRRLRKLRKFLRNNTIIRMTISIEIMREVTEAVEAAEVEVATMEAEVELDPRPPMKTAMIALMENVNLIIKRKLLRLKRKKKPREMKRKSTRKRRKVKIETMK